MPTVKDLKFNPVEVMQKPPFFTCCMCGNRHRAEEGSYIADYPIDDTGHVSFFICSIQCVIDFNSVLFADHVQKYINRTVGNAARIHFKGSPLKLKEFLKLHNINQQ